MIFGKQRLRVAVELNMRGKGKERNEYLNFKSIFACRLTSCLEFDLFWQQHGWYKTTCAISLNISWENYWWIILGLQTRNHTSTSCWEMLYSQGTQGNTNRARLVPVIVLVTRALWFSTWAQLPLHWDRTFSQVAHGSD